MADIGKVISLIQSGDRIALGKGITLIESQNEEDRKEADELLSGLIKNSGNSIRIGITGVPGVGKSTFIESFGEKITAKGKKLAVLAIDPSSPQSKGSILGDKTRMSKLATNPNAFIRPTASGGGLGGVANKTMETILLCEAAGYDVIIIETVGVGQSEIAVKKMTDVFLLLMLAGAGDELQGIKRGIMEMADILVINKADGDNIARANLARKTLENALHLFSPRESGWQPNVLTCSSLSGQNVDDVWQNISEFYDHQKSEGLLDANREEQTKYWLEQTLSKELLHRIKNDARVRSLYPELENKVRNNIITPMQAIDQLMKLIFNKN
jgi:LAO/AO transport system kinase